MIGGWKNRMAPASSRTRASLRSTGTATRPRDVSSVTLSDAAACSKASSTSFHVVTAVPFTARIVSPACSAVASDGANAGATTSPTTVVG
jgi:hypothetical protein